MTVADQVAQWLAEKEITHAFGIVGGGNVALWAAIARLGKTKLISCHHEQAAAQAATYYFRASGRLALCIVTTGAGSSNAITGVIAAWMDSIPLLVISGNEPYRLWESSDERVLGTQGYRSARLVNDVVKGAWQVALLSRPLFVLRDAHKMALEGRPGPVWIDIPKDVQLQARDNPL